MSEQISEKPQEGLTSDIIYGFAQSLLSERYDSPKPTPAFHKELWDYCCSPARQVAIGAPRGHAKSTAVTHAYTLANVLFRYADYVVVISDTERQAIQFLGDIKMELIENDKLRQLFRINKFIKETETEIIVSMGPDNHRFRIVVSSAMGSLRGFKWRGKRPNLIICDDMENDEAVLNEERRAKFREWFYGALLPALSDYGKIRLVGTVLHFDSLLERLMPPTTGDDAKYTVTEGLKQYSTKEGRSWFSIKYRAHTDFDDFSEILWPEKFTVDRLRAIRDDYVAQGYPEGYSQEYLNYPIAEQTAFFRKQDFLPMEPHDYESAKNYYAAMDLAISSKDKRSYTVIVVGGVTDEGYLCIVDVYRQRMDSREMIDLILDIHQRYEPEIFVMEEGALKQSIGPFLKSEMLRRGSFPNIVGKVPSTDKRTRARAIQGRKRQGGVKYDVTAEWYPGLEQELLRFDRGEFDDQVDAMAWLGIILNELQQAPTKDEIEQMEYEEEYEDTYLHYGNEGKSRVTGY